MSDAKLEAIRARDEAWPDNGSSRGGMVTVSRDRRILLARLDAAEARLAEVQEALGDHYPQASTYPDDTSWLTCSCGWDQDSSKLVWPDHILIALAEPTS